MELVWDSAGSGRLLPFYLTTAPPERWGEDDEAAPAAPEAAPAELSPAALPSPARPAEWLDDITSHRHIVCPWEV